MKKICISIILLSAIFAFTGCDNNNESNTSNDDKTSTSITDNSSNNSAQNQPTAPEETKAEEQPTPEDSNSEEQQTSPEPPKETVAAEFSTQIKTKSKNRAKNIEITCGKINETTVKAGTIFSFCGTTGTSKESEGYEKADVIVNKKTVRALGGGNCQVSTTLYNAVLAVPELEVTERHPHGKKVNYVPEGKDAAIAHGSKDLKFKNNSDKDLKIYASSDGKTVSIKLVFVG